MRSCAWLAAILVMAAAGSSARAQRSGPVFTFGGVDPTQLTFKPIDTTASIVPIAQPQSRSVGFKLIDLLPHISFPGSKPLFGQSQFPTQSQMPGGNYLRAFRLQSAMPAH